jgi:hypothetical protein
METDDGARHFIGHNMESKTGRASTRIVKFDPETRRGVTGSGRIYELVGASGVDVTANCLWELTCARADTTSADVSSDNDQPEIGVQRPIAPFIAQLFYDCGIGLLIGKVPATGQSVEAHDAEGLAELLFRIGVRQGYLRLPDFDRTMNRTEFVDVACAVEQRLNQLEREMLCDAIRPQTQ